MDFSKMEYPIPVKSLDEVEKPGRYAFPDGSVHKVYMEGRCKIIFGELPAELYSNPEWGAIGIDPDTKAMKPVFGFGRLIDS